jgi:hypothetical protein
MSELDKQGNPPQPKCNLVVMWTGEKYFGYVNEGNMLCVQIHKDDFVKYNYEDAKRWDYVEIFPLKTLEELMEDYLKE